MAAYPLRAVFQTAPRCRGGVPVQILISVPKRHLKHAVDRNRVKRQVREAYRLCKTPLCEAIPAGETLLVGFLWQADTTVASAKVADRVQKLVKRITEKLCDR